MKIAKLIIFAIALFVLVSGCSQDGEPSETEVDDNDTLDEDVSDDTKSSEDETVDNVTDNETEERDTGEMEDEQILGGDNLDELKNEIELGDEAVFKPTFQQLEKGDKYVFALGFTNTLENPVEFVVRMDFKESYDTFSNKIYVNESLVTSWLNNTEFELEVPSRGKSFKEILVDVGNIKIGEEPKEGTYVFELRALDKDTMDRTNPEVVYKREISVKIS